jgi:hypothetical protein
LQHYEQYYQQKHQQRNHHLAGRNVPLREHWPDTFSRPTCVPAMDRPGGRP